MTADHLSETGELCQLILDEYQLLKVKSAPKMSFLSHLRPVVAAAKNPVELQGVSLLLSSCIKLLTSHVLQNSEQKVLMFWKEILMADILVNR